MCSALVADFACFGTLAQFVFCVRVSGGRLSDTGAVVALRACLILLTLGHLCSMLSARGSLVACFDKVCIYGLCYI